ncbi:hypothetical protein CCAND95_50021 [Capnocytophaga canis]|uniref:Uncharacterized protein n=1 Tax=Capnocytophaga canis TaxID=1848903 RepID=A0A0B7IBX0_9FLAO|nr:hypothetical protein [Capnocytophaga canis]CEN45257.1 hypothetical protein CCAND95_50021 [Capnocytophaga canis]CEN49441.1 hypothetical protein CCAND38_80110 [Capnocytophaga canis]CEN53335.1 hypothetical protein CCAND93_400012 [Capnocytophaga canis]
MNILRIERKNILDSIFKGKDILIFFRLRFVEKSQEQPRRKRLLPLRI